MVLDFLLTPTTRTVIFLLFAVIAVCRAELSVTTPTGVVNCNYTLLTWSGGGANDSYTVEMIGSSGQIITGAIGITTSYLNWFVDLAANTQVLIRIITRTGTTAQSGVFTVQAGPYNSTCGTVATSASSTTANPTFSTSTSAVSSGSISHTSGLLTSQTGASGAPLSETRPPSGSPNVGLIAGAAGGGSVALILLLLGLCLHRRHRKRPVEVVRQFYSIETSIEETLPSTPRFLAHSKYDLVMPMATQYPSTKSRESSALTSQSPHSEPRMSSGPAISPMTPGDTTALPLAIAPSYITAPPGTTPEPVEPPPPMYRDEAEAQIQSQRMRAEEAERVRRYDALIADFCASNRDLISPVLERKLRAARYLPEDDPSDFTAEYWHTTYGVESFELENLQSAYERHVESQELA